MESYNSRYHWSWSYLLWWLLFINLSYLFIWRYILCICSLRGRWRRRKGLRCFLRRIRIKWRRGRGYILLYCLLPCWKRNRVNRSWRRFILSLKIIRLKSSRIRINHLFPAEIRPVFHWRRRKGNLSRKSKRNLWNLGILIRMAVLGMRRGTWRPRGGREHDRF